MTFQDYIHKNSLKQIVKYVAAYNEIDCKRLASVTNIVSQALECHMRKVLYEGEKMIADTGNNETGNAI